jgi:hypothetical protein
LPSEQNDCRQSRRSQIFADRAAAEAKLAGGASYSPMELPQKQICRRSLIFADGATYLPTELPQEPNLPTEPHIFQWSRRSQIFADNNLLTEPQEPNICRHSRPRSQICCRSLRSQICHYRVLHALLFVYFSNDICTSVPFLQTT